MPSKKPPLQAACCRTCFTHGQTLKVSVYFREPGKPIKPDRLTSPNTQTVICNYNYI